MRGRGEFLLAMALLVGSPTGWAEDSPLTDDEVVVRTEGAHRLLLPKDWPVEQRDGRIVPIPIEEYLSLKFDQVGTALDALDRRLSQLERWLEKLEKEDKALQLRLRALEERAQEGR